VVAFGLAVPLDVRFGAGCVREVPAALAGLGATRVLVVTGRTTARADQVRRRLQEAGISTEVVAVPGEPSLELVREVLQRLGETGCDAVLGYGGGSALDVAKAVAVLATAEGDPLDYLEVVGAGRAITEPGLPCVAVPTTAGTGSEVTRNAVLSVGAVKVSLRSPRMLPRVSLVDPDLLVGLPSATIAFSGMDALAQLVEPLLSRRANPFSDALARDGIRRSARSLQRAAEEGMTDAAVREDLALASLFGGLCLANSGLGVVHGLAAAAGARLAAPHGAVCAAVLPASLRVNLAALRERAPEHSALSRSDELAALLTGRSSAVADDAVSWLVQLSAALRVPGLARYGLERSGVSSLVAAAQRASSMKGNPVELTDAEVTEIVTASL
jgi:alcohol dehydrogenase class IV